MNETHKTDEAQGTTELIDVEIPTSKWLRGFSAVDYAFKLAQEFEGMAIGWSTSMGNFADISRELGGVLNCTLLDAKCCLGFVMISEGIEPERLLNANMPSTVPYYDGALVRRNAVACHNTTPVANDAIQTNDNAAISDEKRREKIKAALSPSFNVTFLVDEDPEITISRHKNLIREMVLKEMKKKYPQLENVK